MIHKIVLTAEERKRAARRHPIRGKPKREGRLEALNLQPMAYGLRPIANSYKTISSRPLNLSCTRATTVSKWLGERIKSKLLV